jgi:hypothetical protein
MAALLAASIALGIFLGAPVPARAVSITGLSATLLGTNSADFFQDTAARKRVRDSQIDVLAGSATSFTTRYAAVVGADVSTAATTLLTLNARYRITFSVNANAGQAWQLMIDTARYGALTLVDDGTGSARATLGAVTLTRSGAGTLAGSLGLAALPNLQGGANANQAVSQTGSAVLSGVGTGAAQSVTLNFSFSAGARSSRTGSNGDEAAVRLGLDSALTGFSADDYPGPGSRSLAGDGHFVTATLVPEPSAWLLLTTGLTGIELLARRRRQHLAPLEPTA